jgi:hypothetical protein
VKRSGTIPPVARPRRRLARAARRLRDFFLGVIPYAREIDAANDPEHSSDIPPRPPQ